MQATDERMGSNQGKAFVGYVGFLFALCFPMTGHCQTSDNRTVERALAAAIPGEGTAIVDGASGSSGISRGNGNDAPANVSAPGSTPTVYNAMRVAQAVRTKGIVTLASALALAAEAHPSIKGARERVNAAGLALDAAEYGRFPSLSVDAGAVSGSKSVNGASGTRNQSTISLTQPVYTFGRISNAIDAAQQRVDVARWTVAEAQLNILDQVVVAYYDTLKGRDRVQATQDNVAAHRKLLDIMKSRVDNGIGSQSDLLLAQSRLNQASSEMAAAQSAFRKAQTVLSNLISAPVQEVMNPLIMKQRFRSEAELFSAAQSASPILQRLGSEAAALRFDAKSQQGATLPQFVVRAERVESNVPTPFVDSRVVAAVQYQPGAGLSAFSNAKAAESRAVAAESDIEKARQELRDRVSAIYNDMVLAGEQLMYLQGVKSNNQEIFDSLYRQFQAGKRTWLDVLNAQRETSQIELSFVDAFYNAQAFIRRSELISGQPIETTAEVAKR